MNSAYAPNSQTRVPTRVSQGHVVTTDKPTLRTNSNSKQHWSATQEAKDLDNLRSLGRTVRMDWADLSRGSGRPSTRIRRTVRRYGADRPKLPPEPLVLHLKKQTVRALPADRPRKRDRPHSPRRPSGKLRATKSSRQNGSKHEHAGTHEEHDEHQICRLLVDYLRAPGRLFARHGNNSPSRTLQRSTPPTLCPISQINQGIATKS
jgi:hypothetical protein